MEMMFCFVEKLSDDMRNQDVLKGEVDDCFCLEEGERFYFRTGPNLTINLTDRCTYSLAGLVPGTLSYTLVT